MNKKGKQTMINSRVKPYVNAAAVFTAVPSLIAGFVFALKGDNILSVSEVYEVLERFMPISLFGSIMFVAAAFLTVGVCFRYYIHRYSLVIPSSIILSLSWLVYFSATKEANPEGWTVYLFLYFAACSFAVACMGVVAVWQIRKILHGSMK
jgi:hypothetical protein